MSPPNFRLFTALLFLGLGSWVAPVDAAAQQGTISGQVVTPDRGPIASVQVDIPQLGQGALTGSDGRFTIQNVTPGTYDIRFNQIGYRSHTEEVIVQAGETTQLSVELVREALRLDEVIVTGTPGGTQRRAIGNVVDQLDAEALQMIMPAQNVQDLMSSRSAGMMQLGQSGSPGAGYGARVRGASSIGLANQPIVYIDGVRMDAQARNPGGVHYGVSQNALNTLNPGDIASIEVIKGPAAATLYGTEASAGVIQILTHRGAAGEARYDFTMSGGTRWLWDPAGRTGIRFGTVDGQTVSFNLYEQEEREGLGPVFGYGRLGSFQGTVRGGTESVNYFFSGSYSNETGVLGFDGVEQFSGRMNVDLLLTDEFTANFRVGYTQSDRRRDQTGGATCAICQLGWGRPGRAGTRGFNSAPPETWELSEGWIESDRTTISIEGNHTPTSWLTQRLITGLDLNQEHSWVLWPRQPEGTSHFWGANGLGSKSAIRGRRSQVSLDYAATATFPVSDRLASSTSVGGQYFNSTISEVGGSTSNFPAIPITTLGGGADPSTAESWEESVTVGAFVQQQFDWDNRVFLTGAVRMDDNSAFGAEFDAAVYPKASATWVISEEDFWDIQWARDVRLRGAWGAAGRQPGTFDASRLYTPQIGFRDEPALQPSSFGNPQLEPERSTELEVGFDASILDDRIQVAYTRFDRRTNDLIVGVGIPGSQGFPGSQIVNLGEVKGWGNEFTVDADIYQRPGFSFSLGTQFSTQNNEIIDLGNRDRVSGPGLTQHVVGHSIADLYMIRVLDAELGPDGNVVSATCDGGTGPRGALMGGAPVPCEGAPELNWGSTEPTWLLGVTLSTTFGERLRLHARVEGAGGHVQRGGHFLAAHTSQLSTEAAVLRNDPRDNIFDAYRVHQRDPLTFFEMGFARLREVSGTYTLPESWAGRIGASRGSVTLSGRNLLMLWTAQEGFDIRGESSIMTDMPGGATIWDPELRMPADLGDGVQGTQLPPTAGATFTVRLGF